MDGGRRGGGAGDGGASSSGSGGAPPGKGHGGGGGGNGGEGARDGNARRLDVVGDLFGEQNAGDLGLNVVMLLAVLAYLINYATTKCIC